MSNLSAEQEYELRIRELEQDHRLRTEDMILRREEVTIRSRESRRALWTNPLFVALAAGSAALYGQYIVREQARIQAEHQVEREKKQFCYRAIADFLERANSSSPSRAARELNAVVVGLDLRKECGGDLRELSDLYADTSAPVATPTVSPQGAEPASSSAGECTRIESIRALGWRSGHKTRFCIAKGFDGVHNPFGEYSAGGYCYTGNADACIAKIQGTVK